MLAGFGDDRVVSSGCSIIERTFTTGANGEIHGGLLLEILDLGPISADRVDHLHYGEQKLLLGVR